jgi:murein DD-endopeptidase MepM/ murein hydrolase activator NlpD
MSAGRRYILVIRDRFSGVERGVTINLRAAIPAGLVVLVLPVLMGLGARWSVTPELQQLRAANSALLVENSNYRAATGELTTQIQSLEGVIDELGASPAFDPAQLSAMQKLPALIRSKASGGAANSVSKTVSLTSMLATSLTSPDDTFGVLRDLLQALESRLTNVRRDVERQEALAAATPSIWPAHGWLSGTFGGRPDPITGEPGFHQGLDISAERGRPVFATADGRVESASYSGDFGNLVVLRHDFGLSTRYGHLSGFKVRPGQKVQRGDVIGFVGSTGRATGAHLHYEILASGRLINPLQLLTRPTVP